MAEANRRLRGPLDLIEWVGNKLPDPAMLFIIGALTVMVLSHVGAMMEWSVQPVRPRVIEPAAGEVVSGRPKIELVATGEPLRPLSLLTGEGLYWAIKNLVSNFINFPPLGIVLTGMLGIGLAERVGLFSAVLRWLAGLVPGPLLTPTVVFLGIISNVASDAGYIILPPLAAALYLTVGRPPLAGIAAAFAGVSAGFSANLLIAGTDVLAAGITTDAARVLDSGYEVKPTCNWWFLIVSTFLLTATGWLVTARFVEPRMRGRSPEEGGPRPITAEEASAHKLTPVEQRGLRWAGVALLGVMAVLMAAIFIPGAPLHGLDGKTQRWVVVIVPIVFFAFLTPGIAYGYATGSIRSGRDVSRGMIEAMSAMAPIIVMAFFAAQFVAYFKKSNLGEMLAMAGGKALFAAEVGPHMLILLFIGLVMVLNLFVGSMSAKWTLIAPIFVPMLMLLGISPELTQAGYRVGDSVTNVITPLNAYLIIILAVMQRYMKSAGMGTLVAMMVPYSVIFAVVWGVVLLAWMYLGVELGPEGPLWYTPPQ